MVKQRVEYLLDYVSVGDERGEAEQRRGRQRECERLV